MLFWSFSTQTLFLDFSKLFHKYLKLSNLCVCNRLLQDGGEGNQTTSSCCKPLLLNKFCLSPKLISSAHLELEHLVGEAHALLADDVLNRHTDVLKGQDGRVGCLVC